MKQFHYDNKYVLKYKEFNNSYTKSTDIYQDKLRLGDIVYVGVDHPHRGGEEGRIVPSFDKEDSENLIGVEFEDGKIAHIHKGYLSRRSSEYTKNKNTK